MNKLSTERRVQILTCLIEGNSIRATSRISGVAKNTVVKLLVDAGKACAEYQDKTLIASAFSVTKFGPSATPNKKIFQTNIEANLVMVMSGPGRLFVQILNLSLPG